MEFPTAVKLNEYVLKRIPAPETVEILLFLISIFDPCGWIPDPPNTWMVLFSTIEWSNTEIPEFVEEILAFNTELLATIE